MKTTFTRFLAGSLNRHQRTLRSHTPTNREPLAGPSSTTRIPPSDPSESREIYSRNTRRTQSDEDKPQWLIHKEALRRNFPDGWNPPKKISRPSMSLLKTLHRTDPEQFSLTILSQKFKISPEAVRRILRSKWEPDTEKIEDLDNQSNDTIHNHSGIRRSDGWVHHEKLETDMIPVNLAHTIQSSLPQNTPKNSYSPARRSRSPDEFHHNHSFRNEPSFRGHRERETSRSSHFYSYDPSENEIPATPVEKLGSAFKRSTSPEPNFRPPRRRHGR
ncbi:hypothetical protein MJO28_006299 [Puccinia striiformis f. sp. tritici]|uniref:Required for respiratory growth protein 9, mitochondrial n=2 Tax=Puccinia striiformis TaxID=27350 RepID=A0A2S4VSF8_9BASI|nr:hypothetical protein Pst134EB_012461 [Puccinia striiformis f. sp. tritici]KAI7953752.1 hypothetical protein MJO28_006299 [Puccinia striiformis f. sp. tritici]KAI9605068.1 hypothetical protein H4Q26_003039 [Puccinia striiformis f. sp. tritici PST-130]POW12475.1 hypothetical protein PSTT_04437 [Puccinia striiformis]